VILVAPVADSLGCRALKDGLLCLFFLLVFAVLMLAFIFAVNRLNRFIAGRGPGSRKVTTFSKGAHP
jgi:hypothetical protein